jgi:hypothetical protein
MVPVLTPAVGDVMGNSGSLGINNDLPLGRRNLGRLWEFAKRDVSAVVDGTALAIALSDVEGVLEDRPEVCPESRLLLFEIPDSLSFVTSRVVEDLTERLLEMADSPFEASTPTLTDIDELSPTVTESRSASLPS